jgi:hypothetical protein
MKMIKKGMAGFQIILLISFSFAFAFIFSEYVGVGKAYESISTLSPYGPYLPDYKFQPGGVEGTAEFVGPPSNLAGGVTPPPPGAVTPPPGPESVAGGKGLFGGLFSGQAFGGGAFGAVAGGLAWAGVVYGVVLIGAKMFGFNSDQAKSIALSAAAGVGTYSTISFLATNNVIAQGGFLATYAPLIGLGVGVGILLATYKKTKQEIVTFECLPWEPPTGGQNCELCNKGDLPCSEYRCKSLGQACEIVNPGTEEESCVWISKGDTGAPKITPWPEALSPDGLEYVPDNAISPPNKGFKLLQKPNGCLDPFTKLEFGILTDEPAQCMIDYDGLTKKYDEMTYFFGEESLFVEEHTQRLKVPSPFSETGDAGVPDIHNDGTYTLSVRCRDANGNTNEAAVAFSFCVRPGPDTSQPIIEGTSIESGSPVTFGSDEVPIEVYVNEPAECKWSHQDKAFDAMENGMSCATETYQINSQLNYVCSGTLGGIKDRQDNLFYFRCKDYSTAPGGRNEMTSSYQLLLKGTEELTIFNVKPEGEFEGSTSSIEVVLEAETGFGANNGESICYVSTTPADSSSFWAIDTGFVFYHNQSVFLPEGDYTYHFRCIDAGGNSAEESTMFTVSVDDDLPQIVRVFRDGSGLKIITDEPAECAYSLTSCSYNFEDGLPLLYDDPVSKTTHFSEWDSTLTYHVKCRDLNGNQPAGNECSIIAQGSEL